MKSLRSKVGLYLAVVAAACVLFPVVASADHRGPLRCALGACKAVAHGAGEVVVKVVGVERRQERRASGGGLLSHTRFADGDGRLLLRAK